MAIEYNCQEEACYELQKTHLQALAQYITQYLWINIKFTLSKLNNVKLTHQSHLSYFNFSIFSYRHKYAKLFNFLKDLLFYLKEENQSLSICYLTTRLVAMARTGPLQDARCRELHPDLQHARGRVGPMH